MNKLNFPEISDTLSEYMLKKSSFFTILINCSNYSIEFANNNFINALNINKSPINSLLISDFIDFEGDNFVDYFSKINESAKIKFKSIDSKTIKINCNLERFTKEDIKYIFINGSSIFETVIQSDVFFDNNQYPELIKFTKSGIVIVSKEQRILDCNQNFLDFYKFKDKSFLINSNYPELFSNFRNKNYATEIETSILNGNIFNQTFNLYDEKSIIKELKISTDIVLNIDGSIDYFVFTETENIIDEDFKIELFDNPTKFKMLINNVSDVIWICDLNFKLIYISPSVEKLLGYTDSELINSNISMFMVDESASIIQKAMEENRSKILISSFEEYQDFVFSIELPLRSKEGNVIWSQINYNYLFDKNGLIKGIFGVLQNISSHKLIEKEFLISDERLNIALETSNIGIFEWDTKSGETYLSTSYCSMLCYEPDEFNHISKALEIIIHPEDYESFLNEITLNINDKNVRSSKLRHIKKNGGWIWLEARYKVVERDEQLLAIRIIGTVFDSRYLVNLKKDGMENDNRYKLIFENAQEGIFQSTITGDLLEANPAFAQIFGYYNFEDMKVSIHDLRNQLYVNPEDRDYLIRELYKKGVICGFEFQVYKKDGSIVWIYENARAIKNEEGRIEFIEGYILDIDKRKSYEGALWESEERLKAVVRSANVLIFVIDKNGIITLSEGKMLDIFKFHPNQLVGISIYDIYEENPDVKEEIKKALAGEERIAKLEIQNMVFETSYSPIRDNHGEISGVVAIATNITDRMKSDKEKERLIVDLQYTRLTIYEEAKKLVHLNDKIIDSEMKLTQMNEEKDKFISIISHDLRSPLSGILGVTENLVYYFDRYSSSELKASLETIAKTSNHMFKLLDNLLIWARLNRQNARVEKDQIHLKSFVKANIELLINNAIQKSIDLVNSIENDLFVLADENMLNTILRNLIANAIKFTRESGRIEILSEMIEEGKVAIGIKDNGIGMSEDMAEKLFGLNTFTTLGTSGEKGTGLGLIICKEMVEKNDGRIWVESEEDVGTTFKFTLSAMFKTGEDLKLTSMFIEEIENENTPKFEILIDDYDSDKKLIIQSLIHDLETKFRKRNSELMDTQIIGQIVDYAEDLKILSEKYDFEPLQKFVDGLFDNAKIMDIFKVNQYLEYFEKFIEELKTKIS